MRPTPSEPHAVRFGDCALDLRSGELTRDGQRTLLPEQPFRILVLLLRQPRAMVTREDLRRELWSDGTFVDFEHGLNAAVKRLREALGDSATTPRFIETLPRRGYRFIGDVQEERAASELAGPPARTAKPSRGRAWTAWGGGILLLVVLGAVSLRPAQRADRAPGLIRLTSTSGLNADPALSPDGRLLAYASDRGGSGGFDLWVQPVGGGEPLQLTRDPADEAEPAFSPDGTEIMFSRRDTGLFAIGALGGTARLIARAEWARTPRYSPDGRWIAYWTGFPATVVAGGIPDALASISIVPSAGGPPQILHTRVASARYPIWSPDGERILFLGENSDAKVFDWYLLNRDGSHLIKTGAVQKITAAGIVAGPPIPGVWSRSRGTVVFATNEGDSSNIWEIPISADIGSVSGTPRRLTIGSAIERSPTVSDSGRIAFSSVIENVDVWRVPVDEHTGVATGPLERVTDDAASDRLRGVSTDGKTMVFISSRTHADEVWVRELASGRERQVTHGGADDATLSPDGSRIAFSRNEGGTHSLAIVGTQGGPPSPLCAGCSIPADWSPDGTHLLVGRGRPSRLTLYDLSTGEQTELTAHPTWNLQQAHFSRDAQWVAFHTTNSPNVRQTYVTRAVPGKTTVPQEWVPVVMDHGCHPSWSADGSLLYHFSFRDGAFCPWVQRVDPVTKRPIGSPRAVLHLHNPRLRAASGAAATNTVQGGHLYMTATEATGNIWLLDDPRE